MEVKLVVLARILKVWSTLGIKHFRPWQLGRERTIDAPSHFPSIFWIFEISRNVLQTLGIRLRTTSFTIIF